MQSPEEIYRKQVLKSFFKNGILLKIPAQNRKKDVVLQKVSSRLIEDKMYSDAELNEVLKKIFPDFEILKTELLASRFIKTTKGQYQLVKTSEV